MTSRDAARGRPSGGARRPACRRTADTGRVGCQIGPSVKVKPRANLTDRRVRVDQVLEFAAAAWHASSLVIPSLSLRPGTNCACGSDWTIGPGTGILQPRRRRPRFDHGRTIVHRQHEARALASTFLIAAFLCALGRAVVAGRLRLHVVVLAERLDDLVVDVVDDVAADRRHALGGLTMTFIEPSVCAAGGLAEDAGHQFDRAG